jgi:hypothetical protein
MARQRTGGYWTHRIHQLAESDILRGAGRGRITRALEQIAAEENRLDAPSERVVGRILQMHRAMDERDRAIYREFHWPHAMLTELVPWEASRFALDVLKACRMKGAARPTVQEITWLWRLHLATPETPIDRLWGPLTEVIWDVQFEGGQFPEMFEWSFAFEPWIDDARRDDYDHTFADHAATPEFWHTAGINRWLDRLEKGD